MKAKYILVVELQYKCLIFEKKSHLQVDYSLLYTILFLKNLPIQNWKRWDNNFRSKLQNSEVYVFWHSEVLVQSFAHDPGHSK